MMRMTNKLRTFLFVEAREFIFVRNYACLQDGL